MVAPSHRRRVCVSWDDTLMATLALAVVGAAVGGALVPASITVLGATISGATIGAQVGSLAGAFVDQALFGGSGQTHLVEGPRLSELQITSSTEGAPIPRIYGRVRLGGQVIWATNFEEKVVTNTSTTGGGGGKGFGGVGGSSQTNVVTKEYLYFANFAVAVAEGEISNVGRVWADGREIDLSQITYRVHKGTETQLVDTLIEARKGANNAPAYRGTAYIVFERLPLADYGNRLPQLSFEVYRSIDSLSKEIRSVVMIPGSGEFAYAPNTIANLIAPGDSEPENVHTRQGGTNWSVAVDQLEAALPNTNNISLVVSWFGTDVRAGVCQLQPGVERSDKQTSPDEWSVAGEERDSAYVVSLREGRAAYGGTPSDKSVIDAIGDLKARGFDVTLTPFIFMDVEEGNALLNPYGGTGQPPYPWRGRITVYPAPGEPNTPDKTAAAATQIASFVGTAQPGDFSIVDGAVVYSGPAEWSYRRMILHMAYLAKAAGGIDAFLIGTELRGLTWVRESTSSYPFVSALISLAADVKGILGAATNVTYAADWSEYFGHQPTDGSNDVYFHLDPLWSSPSIDAVAIDVYWPLSDWRDGNTHLDFLAGAHSIHDLDYLRANVGGGEGYDWYYASSQDRDNQVRTPITDGAGKPWVFRYKDIKSWWLNQHYNRPGGVESGMPTAWEPESKPFWFMEAGCPAIDKGSNQPNVFVDPKSSENAVPYYSRGTRDDLIQNRFLRAFIETFDHTSDGFVESANPISGVYGGRMVNRDRIYVYTWDARPYPAFPLNLNAWADGENWRLGHWLTGRLVSAQLAELVAQILIDFGFYALETSQLKGTVPGYVIDRVMSTRDALQPLELSYFFDSLESGGLIRFRHRGAEPAVSILRQADLVENRPHDALLTLTRGQETELPASAKIRYLSSISDYQQAVAEARRLTGASGRVSQADLPIVLGPNQADNIAESWLFEAWAARDRSRFTLPPSWLALEPGDVVTLEHAELARQFRITEIGEHGARDIEARSIDPNVYGATAKQEREGRTPEGVLVGQPLAEFLDLPLLRGDEPPEYGYVAAWQAPWPGGVAVYGSPEETGFNLKALATAPATIGTTLDDLQEGPAGRIDHGARLRVQISGEELVSITRLQLLAGQNVAAVRNGDGEWEVLQFQNAELVDVDTYELSELLRGQSGTEFAMRPFVSAGTGFVLINTAIAPVDLTGAEIRLPYSWRYGPSVRDIGDASYVEREHTFQGLGLKPLSPVHVRASRFGGDVTINWMRRTRIGGDSWESPEVPLSEDSERYEVDVLDGETVLRTLAAAAPSVTYTAAQQVADFGSAQPTYSVRIYQLSGTYGRGTPRPTII